MQGVKQRALILSNHRRNRTVNDSVQVILSCRKYRCAREPWSIFNPVGVYPRPQDLVCARRELEQLQGEFLGLLESSAESRVQARWLKCWLMTAGVVLPPV